MLFIQTLATIAVFAIGARSAHDIGGFCKGTVPTCEFMAGNSNDVSSRTILRSIKWRRLTAYAGHQLPLPATRARREQRTSAQRHPYPTATGR